MSRKLLTTMAVLGFALILLPAAASAQGYACFPTCSTVDGRMLAFESAGLSTFNSNQLTFVIGAPATSTQLEFGLFDGDANTANWDFGSSSFVYELFADPNGDGTGTTLLQTWTDADFGNNVWTDQIMAHDPGAQSESGNYFYRLLVTYTSLGANDIGTFKIRTPDTYQIRIDPQAFSFIGMVFGVGDFTTIHPSFPTLTPNTYDGSWAFFTDIEASATMLQFWDGDMDFGQADCNPLFQDTDDPDTLGSDPTNPTPVFLPPWAALATTHEEGVAIGRVKGCGQTTGDPTDDATDFVFYQRSPSVIYTITTPDGTVLTNTNPSGNQEWETFTLTTAAIGGDFNNLSLPPGRYRIDMIGMDLGNFNAWFLPSAVNSLCEDGSDCVPRLKPYLVGDTVFFDADGDGAQDPGEPGIAGVVVNLRGPFGGFKESITTDSNGHYNFGVFPNTYTVEVDPSNFGPGGALEGLVSTTGGESITDTVVNANVLTYDFGYIGNSSIGDFVWYDANNNGLQDDGPTSGLSGVTVNLTEAGVDGLFGTPDDVVYPPMVTAGNGSYDFTSLVPGLYRVDVDESTLPAGLALTTGNEPLTVNLGSNEDCNDADFGYVGTGSIGDRVWEDLDGDGNQEAGEPGINGVDVDLLDAGGMVIAMTTTSGNGSYLFPNLPAGNYSVRVNGGTLPAGLNPTFDIDGVGTPNVAASPLAAGQNRTDVDFGYNRPPGNICLPDLDFETDGLGNALHKGQIIDDEFAAFGITVTTNSPVNHPAMIFDSSSPTGGDWDLGTPNQAFGGPGVGSGGGPGAGANTKALGRVLIVSEDRDQNDPDDNANGGTIIFTFATSVRLTSVDILDIDSNEAMGEIRAYDGSGALVASAGMQLLGNNSFQTVSIAASNVARLEIEFPKSGAVGNIVFCVEEEICVDKADADPAYGGGSGGHAVYLPGIGSGRFIFDPVGTFTQSSDGTASIVGTIHDRDNLSSGFTLNVQLSGRTTSAPSGSPKKELAASAYSANGGPVDPSTWTYYTGLSGTLFGVGGYAGAVVTIARTGPAFQVGVGANGKNIHDGASSWFQWTVVQHPSSGGIQSTGQGDFNLDFVACDGGGSACTAGKVRDDFSGNNFSGSTGSDDWAGNWIENDPQSGGAGPGAGQVKVINGYLRLDDAPDTGGYPSLAREVDLSGADFATFRFDFDTSSGVDTSDAVTIEVSNNGGASWTTLEVITGITGSSWGSREYDISAFISSETQVRFRVSNLYGGDNEYFWVDFAEIEWGCDSTPPISTKDIYFVVGNTSLNAGDSAVKARLEGRGYGVTLVTPASATAAAAEGYDLVVISSTVLSSDLGSKLTYAEVPIVNWESHLYDDLGMTGLSSGTHYGSAGSQTKVNIVNGAALSVASGLMTTTTSGQNYTWGIPNGNAAIFATLSGASSKAAFFGYKTGDSMPGLIAPARRVGVSLDDATPTYLTGEGWTLFDAALDWACDDDNGGGGPVS